MQRTNRGVRDGSQAGPWRVISLAAWRNLTPEVVRFHLRAPFSNTAGLARRNIFARFGPMTDLICLVIPYP